MTHPQGSGDAALVADIGGTNARFALTTGGRVPRLSDIRSLVSQDYASLQHAAEHYLQLTGAAPRAAAIAVACPIVGDEVRMTNRSWSFSRSELQQRLGLDTLRVINDFGAIARAVPALAANDQLSLYGDPQLPLHGPISVIGPGTGFGAALLVGSTRHGWHAVETEGGHVSFAALNDEEHLVNHWVTARYGRTSTERLLSGAGLSHIEAALACEHDAAARPTLRDPADIVAAALEGHDVLARRALARFCAILGSTAGDIALLHGARSVVIAGGIVPRFIGFLRSSAFRERFLAKGRFAPLLEQVAVQLITHAQPGLLGAAIALQEDDVLLAS
jgi:glucokinase